MTDSAEAGSEISRRALLGSAVLVALAGCSGDGDENGTSSADESEPTDTEGMDNETTEESTTNGEEFSIESQCQVDNSISELPVVGCQSEADGGDLLITTTFRNEGEQTANLFDYRFRVRVFEAEEASLENDITGSRSTQFPEGREVGPAETLAVTHRMALDESSSPEDVELYTVTMFCQSSDAAYCE